LVYLSTCQDENKIELSREEKHRHERKKKFFLKGTVYSELQITNMERNKRWTRQV
jgi:hypothetical protein